MKILIINPNSDDSMTEAILATAREFCDDGIQVDCFSTPGAPSFIDTYSDTADALPGMRELLARHESSYDGFIIACHCDPNLDVMKESTAKPMVGIGEASMKMASMLGHRFSVVSTDQRSAPNKEALIRSYHLENGLASVRYPAADASNRADQRDEELYREVARAAVQEDGAEVIVLGCAGMTGLDKKLQSALGVPVLDGVVCALIVATGLVRYHVGTSKIRRYRQT